MTDLALIERITRSLAFMLRHQPEKFDLDLDPQGFAELEDVVHALNERLGEAIAEADVREAVLSGDRVRYEIQDQRIRALYGHSIPVEPGPSSKPPEVLFVAIPEQDVERAQRYGLRGGRRRFLHLALTKEDACDSGRRTSRHYTVLRIRALDAWEEGIAFYDRKALWLAEEVPTHLIEVEGTYHDGTDPVMTEGGRFQDRGRERDSRDSRDSRHSRRGGRGRGRHGDRRGRGFSGDSERGRERPPVHEHEPTRAALPGEERHDLDPSPVAPDERGEHGEHAEHAEREVRDERPERQRDRGDRGERRERRPERHGSDHGERPREQRAPERPQRPAFARERESAPPPPPPSRPSAPARSDAAPSSPFGAGLDGDSVARREPPPREEPRRPAREERPSPPRSEPDSGGFGAGL